MPSMRLLRSDKIEFMQPLLFFLHLLTFLSKLFLPCFPFIVHSLSSLWRGFLFIGLEFLILILCHSDGLEWMLFFEFLLILVFNFDLLALLNFMLLVKPFESLINILHTTCVLHWLISVNIWCVDFRLESALLNFCLLFKHLEWLLELLFVFTFPVKSFVEIFFALIVGWSYLRCKNLRFLVSLGMECTIFEFILLFLELKNFWIKFLSAFWKSLKQKWILSSLRRSPRSW